MTTSKAVFCTGATQLLNEATPNGLLFYCSRLLNIPDLVSSRRRQKLSTSALSVLLSTADFPRAEWR